MSIQKVQAKKSFLKIRTTLLIIFQIFHRAIFVSKPKIFFRYFTSSTHPAFKRFYDNAPLHWANIFNYEIAHWINYPAYITSKPFVLEINDHPLATVSFKKRGLCEPGDVLEHIYDAEQVYASKYCRKILIASNGYRKLFNHYFGFNYDHKIIEVHSPGCLPQKKLNLMNINQPIRFLCLASDYMLKGVDLVIEAWLSIKDRNKAKLILACPNIPLEIIKKLSGEPSIEIISKAPLSDEYKKKLLYGSAVTIAPTHISGGSTIAEGMEFGHHIIHFEFHNTEFDKIGDRIKVPYHFYSINDYGYSWKTIDQFKQILYSDKKNSRFTYVIQKISSSIESIINNPEYLNQQRKFVFKNAQEDFSLRVRNEKLLEIYKEISLSCD
jgi:glycosyltransferase involved in cell wall biosynthesis